MGAGERARHVADKVLLLALLAAEDLPEAEGLLVVLGLDGTEEVRDDGAGPLLVRGVDGLDGLVLEGAEG